jgi:NADPH:quinone reductase
MRAAWYAAQGPAAAVLEVGWLPRPDPGPGEVRVRVHASGVNPTDTYARSGARAIPMPAGLLIPDQDGAGVVDAVGRGVPDRWLGQRVWMHMTQWRRPHGTAAEWVVTALDRVAVLPAGYSFAIGACLGIPWLTANLAVSALGTIAARDLLVTHGTGAVAIYAIQVAARRGARVIATVGSERGEELARQAGAAAVVNHREGDVMRQLDEVTGGRGVGRVIESRISANAALYPALLSERARVVVYGTPEATAQIDVSAAIRAQTEFRFIYAYRMSRAGRRRATERLTEWESAGGLTHLPVDTYQLDDIAAAHLAVEHGNHGRRSVIELPTRDAEPGR